MQHLAIQAFQFQIVALAIDTINGHDPSNKMHHQSQLNNTKQHINIAAEGVLPTNHYQLDRVL